MGESPRAAPPPRGRQTSVGRDHGELKAPVFQGPPHGDGQEYPWFHKSADPEPFMIPGTPRAVDQTTSETPPLPGADRRSPMEGVLRERNRRARRPGPSKTDIAGLSDRSMLGATKEKRLPCHGAPFPGVTCIFLRQHTNRHQNVSLRRTCSHRSTEEPEGRVWGVPPRP